ncbi:MAG: peptidylprolyl isomerase [Acidobacteria bacterium]|nr:peptidylprolyl isomerase [Acidobacteriota bacterium]
MKSLRTAGLILSAVTLLSVLGSCSAETPREAAKPDSTAAATASPEPKPFTLPASDTFTLVTDAGEITIKLEPGQAPRNAYQVKQLAARGFYDGVGFHRVLRNTMVQAGCPNSKDRNFYDDGKGDAGVFIPFEDNDLKMTAGAVAMAHGRDKDSASSQFFICVADYPKWEHEYTIIGRVTKGLDVARKISLAPTLAPDLPTHPKDMVVIKSVRFEEPPPPRPEEKGKEKTRK